MLWTSKFGGKKAVFATTGLLPIPKLRTVLIALRDLLFAGKLKLVIDKRYALYEVVEAIPT
jgi:hypothetical protein